MTNAAPRQSHRSAAGHHHQRQYSSEQIPFDSLSSTSSGSGNSKWLHSSATSQQVEYSRMIRSMQRGMNGEFFAEGPGTPPLSLKSLSHQSNGDDLLSSDLSPGILDLHSFDTELLADVVPVVRMYDGGGGFGYDRGRSFDDAEQSFYDNRQSAKARPLPPATDKEKAGAVAKIKVVVRKRPLNKKEIAKKEDDVITTELNSNSLTVHETKLKIIFGTGEVRVISRGRGYNLKMAR